MSILGTDEGTRVERARNRYSEATWFLRNLQKQSSREVKSLWYRIKVFEDKILRFFEGLERKIGVRFIVTDEGKLLFESEGYQFMPFWIDEMPWATTSSDNTLLVSLILENDCPLGTIDVYYRPQHQERSELLEYAEEMNQAAHEQKTHSELWEKDLLELIAYINENRVRHIRIGVICLAQLTSPDVREMVEDLAVNLKDSGFLFFGALNGFWNLPSWDDLLARLKRLGKGQLKYLLPYNLSTEVSTRSRLMDAVIALSPRLVETDGYAGKAWHSLMQVKGLWMTENELQKTLIAESWLRDILPFKVKEKGDVIVVSSTFYAPIQQEPHAAPIIDQFDNRNAVLWEKERKDQEQSEKGNRKSRESTFTLHEDERTYLQAYDLSKKLLREDRLVFVSSKILAQADDPTRCTRLLESVGHRLRENNVLYQLSKSRDEQVNDLRSILPVVTKRDAEEDVFPYPLQVIARSLTPTRERAIPPEELKILIGEDLILGDAYFWRLLDTFCLLAEQQAGKTTLLHLLALRLDGLLPEGATFWIYDGTDALEQDPEKEAEYGWIPIAQHLNRNIKQDELPARLASGVFFASAYEDPRVLYEDLLRIPKAGGRCIVFSALRSQHEEFSIEQGFFQAYQEHSRSKIPGALWIDEVEHLVKDLLLAELVFGDIARHSSKRNQGFGWTSHGFSTLPSTKEHDIRGKARQNTKKICIGPTNLIADLAEEANINFHLYPEKAKLLTELVTEVSVQSIRGTFIAAEYGGELLEPFRAVFKAEEVELLIQRKSEEDRKRYGV